MPYCLIMPASGIVFIRQPNILGAPMDLLASMKIFARVVECGSFSAVARETGLSQPTISKQVSALEKHLGAKMIRRSTRQIMLTETGSEFYERCTRILSEMEEAEASVGRRKSVPSGTLRVNIPITYGRMYILPTLWKFLADYPDIKIDLRMDDHFADLIREGIDVAIRIGALADSSMIAKKIGNSQRLIVASPRYLEKHGEPKSIEDLRSHSCIVYSLLTTRNEWHFDGPGGREIVRVSGRFTANSPDAIREAALSDIGIAVVPTWLIGDCVKAGSLRAILPKYAPTPLEVHAIYPEGRYVPAKVRCFIDHLRAETQT